MLPPLKYNADAQLVAPSAILGKWATVVAAGEVDDQDNGTITNPATQIATIDDRIFPKGAIGTLLALCLGYDDGLTGITDPVVKLFGRYDEDERWELVPNLEGAVAATLVTAATDLTDGTLKYTTVKSKDSSTPGNVSVFDVGAFSHLAVGIETALAGTGDKTNAIIQARLWG